MSKAYYKQLCVPKSGVHKQQNKSPLLDPPDQPLSSYVVKLGDPIRHVDIDHFRNSSASESFPISTKYVVKHSHIDYILPVLTNILPRL